MNIDIQKLKAECDEEITRAYREGWKEGYLDTVKVNPHPAGRVAESWGEGRIAGRAARRDEDERKTKEQHP